MPLPEPSEWTLYAACVDDHVDNYFAEGTVNEAVLVKRAKCGACPVRRDCLEDALAVEPDLDAGVWGGTTANERRAIRAGQHHPAQDFPFADVTHLSAVRSRTHLGLVPA